MSSTNLDALRGAVSKLLSSGQTKGPKAILGTKKTKVAKFKTKIRTTVKTAKKPQGGFQSPQGKNEEFL